MRRRIRILSETPKSLINPEASHAVARPTKRELVVVNS